MLIQIATKGAYNLITIILLKTKENVHLLNFLETFLKAETFSNFLF